MRLILLSLLAVISVGAFETAFETKEASADRYRRTYSRPVYRTTTVTTTRRVYRGPTRSTVYVNNGHYRFNGGATVVYRRPVITRRYYDYRIRPTVIVENYPAQDGYIWVSGHWNWNGAEWVWIGGHYAPNPNY
jgi:hypothetical protein